MSTYCIGEFSAKINDKVGYISVATGRGWGGHDLNDGVVARHEAILTLPEDQDVIIRLTRHEIEELRDLLGICMGMWNEMDLRELYYNDQKEEGGQ